MTVLAGVGKYYDYYFDALTDNEEADYKREKMDQHMKRIVGNRGKFFPFEERYDYVYEVFTGKKLHAALHSCTTMNENGVQ